MAREDDSGEIRREFLEIEVIDIMADPGQPRKRFEDAKIKELMASIEAEGLLQPVIVKPSLTYKQDGKVILIAGERRIRAVKKLGWPKIPAIILWGKTDTFALSLVENVARENLNPIEEAQAFLKLIKEKNWTQPQVAKLIGRSQAYVSQRLILLALPEEIQMMIIEGKLPKVTAINLAQYKGTKGELIKLAHDIIDQKLSAEQARDKMTSLTREKRMKESGVGEVLEGVKVVLEAKVSLVPVVDKLCKYFEALLDLTPAELKKFFMEMSLPKRSVLLSAFGRIAEDLPQIKEVLDQIEEED